MRRSPAQDGVSGDLWATCSVGRLLVVPEAQVDNGHVLPVWGGQILQLWRPSLQGVCT